MTPVLPRLSLLLSIALLAACSPPTPPPADGTSPAVVAPAPREASLMAFWEVQRRGANSMNQQPPDRAYFEALHGTGATWVRLAPDKWPTAGKRDFLIGDADHYDGLVQADVVVLRRVLDDAHAAGMSVVLAPLSLPLLRWRQHNNNRRDDRLWQALVNQKPAQAFWRDLATALKGHPALVGYNLINEPAPEAGGGLPEHASAEAMRAWYAGVQGGSRDLRRFYAGLVSAVREVEADMPLMLDAGWYAAADSFTYWPAPLEDPNLLYSVHMYEPYAATSAANQGRPKPYRYPGTAPFGEEEMQWDARQVAAYVRQPMDWARQHGLKPNRMVVGEFGCMRRWPDCPTYLRDVLAVLKKEQAHWAFYAYREDGWDGMDYELGDQGLSMAYWNAEARGEVPVAPRTDTALFRILTDALREP